MVKLKEVKITMEVKSSISIDVNKSSEEKYQLIRKEIIEVTNGHNTRKKVNIVNNDCIKINKKNFKIKKIITKYTSFLDEYQPTTSERFYCICQDIREVVLCKYCQEVKSKYINLKKGYTTYCSNKCATKSPDRLNNIKKTNLERYGCVNVFQSEKIKEKSKNTIQEKYNVDNISKLDEIKEKKCQTSLRNYGVKHTLQAQEVKASIKQTNLEKRNVEYPSQCPKVREKVIQTNLKKYGKEH